MKKFLLSPLLAFLFLSHSTNIFAQDVKNLKTLPTGFVYVDEIIPTIKVDLVYANNNNFVGKKLTGYNAPRAILTIEAANALKKVQAELQPFGLGLKIYDAYRPEKAVKDLVEWTKDVADTKNKNVFYPSIEKSQLVQNHYIYDRSSHSRGSALDVTLVSLQPGSYGQELDLGTHFDFMGEESAPDSLKVSPSQRANRLLLRSLMQANDFEPLHTSWWHFSYKKEPFKQTFDFDVQ
jgi:D-alanyl-D-alanine dipeptidase